MSLKEKIKENCKIHTYHFNTKFRQKYYKNPSSKCTMGFNLSSKFSAVRLSSLSLPNSWYLFSSLLENNKFIIQMENTATNNTEVLEVVIPEGNYSSTDLETFLNSTYFYESGRTYGFVKIKFTINKLNLKSQFSLVNTNIESDVKFHLIFIDGNSTSIMTTCGWLLGFRYGKYFSIKDEIYSEGLFDGAGDKYIYFCLVSRDLNGNNNHKIIFDNEREMSLSNLENPKVILSKIHMRNGKFSINLDTEVDNAYSFNKLIIFSKPKEFDKVSISLLDEYGQEIFLNNMDFSFSLEFTEYDAIDLINDL
tara:strand:- start:667 stop:1590 length:924 start_codon:yes stop_codon:yes gene_type:complete